MECQDGTGQRTSAIRQIQYIHAVLRDEHPQRHRTPLDARTSIKIAKGLSVGDVKRILAEAQRARLYTL